MLNTTVELEVQRLHALRTIARALVRLKWLAAATRFQIAAHRHGLALKYGYNPAQPRVPRGNSDGGEWTDAGSQGGKGTESDRLIRLAGEIPTGDLPEIPKERPPTSRERTAAYKTAARQLKRFGGPIGKLIEGAEWLHEHSPLIQSYRDPPKTLEELQRDVSAPGLGYDVHHIVEQTQAERDGFARERIDAQENLIRIPRMKHWDINSWYQTKNPDFDWQTPRQYLSGRNWDVRRAVGLKL